MLPRPACHRTYKELAHYCGACAALCEERGDNNEPEFYERGVGYP